MQRFFAMAVIGMALSFAGCGPPPVTKIATFLLEPSTSEQRTEVARVLAARFDGYRMSSGPLTTHVLPDAVVVEFRGNAPADAELRSIGGVQGIFRVAPVDARNVLLFSDLDVEDASSFATDAGGAISIKLTERAGAKMAEFTKRNIGRLLITTLDRKEISRAQISGEFARMFQTTGLDQNLARNMAVILRHGRLPVAVTKVDIRQFAQ